MNRELFLRYGLITVKGKLRVNNILEDFQMYKSFNKNLALENIIACSLVVNDYDIYVLSNTNPFTCYFDNVLTSLN